MRVPPPEALSPTQMSVKVRLCTRGSGRARKERVPNARARANEVTVLQLQGSTPRHLCIAVAVLDVCDNMTSAESGGSLDELKHLIRTCPVIDK
jgi:hypothetical protein